MNLTIASLPIFLLLGGDDAPSWRQFRGPSGSVAVGTKGLPTEIGPKQYVIWKTPLPKGHSSPVVDGDRIFLTKPLGTGLRKFLNRQLSKLKFWPWHNHQILLQPSSQRKSVENGELYPGAKGIEPTTNGQKLQKP